MTANSNVSQPSRPNVLHVSGDFPDPVEPAKTPVIRALVDLTDTSFDHGVYSINRKSPGMPKMARTIVKTLGRPPLSLSGEDFEYGRAFTYEAPARGIYHKAMLQQLGDMLALNVRKMLPLPDILVAHKLTIEGIAVARMARLLSLPYAVCIQGNTDVKILSARPDLKQEFRAIFHEANTVFAFAPWALQRFEGAFGTRKGPTHLLPCATELDAPVAPVVNGNGLISVFHLKHHKIKNLKGLAQATEHLASGGVHVKLAVYGGGSVQEMRDCKATVGDRRNISLDGRIARSELPQRLNSAAAFVLPSIRESFGLVFIEALFAGLPIIYPKGTAIDGYFDGLPFAIGVDARKPKEIAAAMKMALMREAELKRSLREWQLSRDASRFQRPAIAQVFREGLMETIAN